MPSIISATTTNGLVTSADNSGSLQLATNNGTTAVTIDTSQNVGIGVTPSNWGSAYKALQVGLNASVAGNTSGSVVLLSTNTVFDGSSFKYITTDAATQYQQNTGEHIWRTAASGSAGATLTFSERMRIASDGAISAGSTTSTVGLGVFSNFGSRILDFARYADDGATVGFRRGATTVGTISVTGSATAYNTSSDYRLKENIAPMAGALDLVQQLKPVTYNWKVDGSSGQGFIAHELAEVVPQAVTGVKDALDKDGNPEYQGIDTSFLVATLTAAIQELKAELDATKAEVQALKGTL